uniref:Small ribosomal subunit protein bS6c n=1 Tax=Rhizochromulina marina TaxID=1034831 RepID=A0A514CQ11_9STRA|nr:ribosomal protein S6 [Rhizochromulina marina]QDH81886.1 ribosomal protein S6 [Rhizochromulina marina]
MKILKDRNTYKSMVILGPNCSDSELKSIASSYARELKGLGATAISIVSRGQRDLAYMIQNSSFGYYIEMCFESSPQILPTYEARLKLDKNVLRYLVLNIN